MHPCTDLITSHAPCRVDAGRLGLVEPRYLAAVVEPNDECADAKRPHTTPLGIPLLHASHMLRDIVDGNRILEVQTVRLGLDSCLVDEDSGVGVQASEGEADVGVDETDLGGSDPGILQLHGRTLLASQNNDVLALDSNSACSCSALVSRVCAMATSWGQVAPLLTASPAYSTWNTCPSGLSSVNQFAKLPRCRCWSANLKTG